MAKGRKQGTRVTKRFLDNARKKVKTLPKRGRWPRFDDIVDKKDFIVLAKDPSLIVKHPRTGTVCFRKTVDISFSNDKSTHLAAITFKCLSYDGGAKSLLDTTCKCNYGAYSEKWQGSPSLRAACQRISCPYYKKGFIETALKENLFKKEVEDEIKMKHDADKTEDEKK